MTTDTDIPVKITGADPYIDAFSEWNQEYAAAAWVERMQHDKPLRGDWVQYEDGSYHRIDINWDWVQPTHGRFYLLRDGRASFSGGLDLGWDIDRLEKTTSLKSADFWFFDRGWHRAHGAVFVSMPVSIWLIKNETDHGTF